MAERARTVWIALLALAGFAGGCGPEQPTGSGTQESPAPATSATVLTPAETSPAPSPTTSESEGPGGLLVDASGRLIIPEAGPPSPRPLRHDQPVAAENPPTEEQTGLALEARFVQRGLAGPHGAPEVSAEGIAAAKTLTDLGVEILLTSAGRMTFRSTSRALPISFGSELRARHDRYGHLVLWPQAESFRVVPAGALRTLLDEGRVDVTPLVPGTVESTKRGGKAHGQELRTVVLSSALGKLRLEVATMPSAGLGGPLLCRLLVESVGIDPASSACAAEQVPLAAAIDWADGGGLDFEVRKLTERTDVGVAEALVPPPGAVQVDEGIPESPEGIFLTGDELKNLRNRVIPRGEPDPEAPGEGLLAENPLDVPLTLYLDGVPVARVLAKGKRYVYGMHPGTYRLEWRSFFGAVRVAPTLVSTPALVRSAPLPAPAASTPTP
jgi:hypothetical protein